MNFVDLLENYLILKEKDKELYYDVKDNIDKYKKFIYDIWNINECIILI